MMQNLRYLPFGGWVAILSWVLPLQAAIHVGVDTTTGSHWRTAAALEADNEYGSDGYAIYGLNEVDGVYSAPYDFSQDRTSLPAYIAGITLSGTTYMWSGNGNFGQIEDPDAGNALANTPLLANGSTDPWTFTISRGSSSAFRLTIILSNGDNTHSNWVTTVDDGISVTNDFTVPSNTNTSYYAVFDVAAGSSDVTVTIEYVTAGSQFNVTGFAFDPAEASPVLTATTPDPTHDNDDILPSAVLRWLPSPDAEQQRVYFGTDALSLPLRETLGGSSDTVAPLPTLMAFSTTYYWRVDTDIAGTTYPGSVWSFTTIALGSCDFDNDGWVTETDLLYMAAHWLNQPCVNPTWCNQTDVDRNSVVNFTDYRYVAQHWLQSLPQNILFDFETADLQDWKITDGQFGLLVCDRDFFHNASSTPYNKQGSWFLSSLETLSYTPNDGYTGIVESPVFELTSPEISFLVGGGNGASTYIAICETDENNLEGTILAQAHGINSEVMQRVQWNRPDWVGKKLFGRLYDMSTGGWGHITFDDFSAQGVPDSDLTSLRWANLPGPVDFSAARKAVQYLQSRYSEAEYAAQAYLDQFDLYDAQLRDLEQQIIAGTATQEQLDALVIIVQGYVRDALIANPLVSGQPILFTVHKQYQGDHHNSHTQFPSYSGEINHGSYETTGSEALKSIDFGNDGIVSTLYAAPSQGLIRDPDVHFDGDKIVFAMRNSQADSYHIYEINADGAGLKALTSADGVDDWDPIYMPDDNIVFSSTREPKYVHCNRHIMQNLYRMEADGANIHQISKNTLFDFHPSLTPDGRVAYSRWEYVDRNFGDVQGIWTSNPDGTNHAVLFGNNTVSPGGILNPVVLENGKILCIFGSCHDRPWGALALLDRNLGVDLPQPGKPNPVQKIWPESAINLCGGWDGTAAVPTPYEGIFGFDNFAGLPIKYEDPFALDDNFFLVARTTDDPTDGEQTGIYLVDVFGNEIMLHTEAPGCFDPMPIRPRSRPFQRSITRDYETANPTGRFYVQNVYEGTHMEGVQPGEIKYLRVVEAPKKLYWTYNVWGGQGIQGPGMAWHDFYSKQIVGDVPVEADGSAYFEVPAEVFVYFQLLDQDKKMIQTMRTGTIVQSGETLGCIGCHDRRTDSAPLPQSSTYTTPLALLGPPRQPESWYGPERRFNYLTEVQPVFDNNCMSCHDYTSPGGPAGGLNLAGDKTVMFNTSYMHLSRQTATYPYIGRLTGAVGGDTSYFRQAKTWGSHNSPLIEALDDATHADVVSLTTEERERLITWVDLNAPYYPVHSSAYPNNPAGRSPLTGSQLSQLTSLTGHVFHFNYRNNQIPLVSFDRPELSPCLQGLSVGSQDYNSALAIIQQGAANLTANPRADMLGHVPNATDQTRTAKYNQRKAIENANRDAIRNGAKNYD